MNHSDDAINRRFPAVVALLGVLVLSMLSLGPIQVASAQTTPVWNIEASPPTGFLFSVFMVDASEGWAVGNNATHNGGVVLHYSGGVWNIEASPPTGGLRSVFMVSASEGWAVGYDSTRNGGVVLHYSGGVWNIEASPPTAGLSSVFMAGSSEGWAVGGDSVSDVGVVLHYAPLPVDHFVFDSIGAQTVGVPFLITITAVDVYGDTVTSYVDTNTLSASAGTIDPEVTTAFIDGVWTGSVTLDTADAAMTIHTIGSVDAKVGMSDPFAVSEAPPPTCTLTVTTQTDEGVPLAGVEVSFNGTAQTTDETGTTSFVTLPCNSCPLQVESPLVNDSATFTFHSWSDSSTENPRSVDLNADLALTANFQVDQAPEPEILLDPITPQYGKWGTWFTYMGTLGDGAEGVEVTIEVKDHLGQAVFTVQVTSQSGGTFLGSFHLILGEEGQDTVYASASGYTSASTTFYADFTAPTSTVTAPPNEATVNSLSTIEGTADDPALADGNPGSGVASVSLAIQQESDGFYWTGTEWGAEAWLPATGTTSWICDTGTISWTTGWYSIYADAADNAGNAQATPTLSRFQFQIEETHSYLLTVNTDALTYHPGDSVTITGTLTDNGAPVPSVPVGILVTDPGDGSVFIDAPTTNSTGQYETSFTLDGSAQLGQYAVSASYDSASAVCHFQVEQPSQYSLTVETDYPNYYRGDTVTMLGTLLNNGAPVPSVQVSIVVTDPSSSTIFTDQPVTNGTGYYETSLSLAGDSPFGTYTVYSSYDTANAQTTFQVDPPPSGCPGGFDTQTFTDPIVIDGSTTWTCVNYTLPGLTVTETGSLTVQNSIISRSPVDATAGVLVLGQLHASNTDFRDQITVADETSTVFSAENSTPQYLILRFVDDDLTISNFDKSQFTSGWDASQWGVTDHAISLTTSSVIWLTVQVSGGSATIDNSHIDHVDVRGGDVTIHDSTIEFLTEGEAGMGGTVHVDPSTINTVAIMGGTASFTSSDIGTIGFVPWVPEVLTIHDFDPAVSGGDFNYDAWGFTSIHVTTTSSTVGNVAVSLLYGGSVTATRSKFSHISLGGTSSALLTNSTVSFVSAHDSSQARLVNTPASFSVYGSAVVDVFWYVHMTARDSATHAPLNGVNVEIEGAGGNHTSVTLNGWAQTIFHEFTITGSGETPFYPYNLAASKSGYEPATDSITHFSNIIIVFDLAPAGSGCAGGICQVTFHTDPSSVGSITVAGYGTFTNGQSANLPAGYYTVTANPPSDCAFSNWAMSGGVFVSGGQTATMTVTGSGTVTAVFGIIPIPEFPFSTVVLVAAFFLAATAFKLQPRRAKAEKAGDSCLKSGVSLR